MPIGPATKSRINVAKKILGCGCLCALLLGPAASAATKVHVIAFGKWTSVQLPLAAEITADRPVPLKIRPLLIDGRIKEFTLGAPHEVTDRQFVVRRMFRVNDGLPDDASPHWQWQRGGWLLVDRTTGRISPINLPEFDVDYSAASWYRDYIAYCGISDDGRSTFAIVAQLGRRKPVLKKPLADAAHSDSVIESAPGSACPVPSWQRSPTRVSFEQPGIPRQTFAIRGHVVDVVNESEEEEEGTK